MKRMCYRLFQTGMKYGMAFLPWKMPEVLSGAGIVKELPQLIKSKGYKTVLVVTGSTSVKIHLIDPLLNGLEKIGVRAIVYSGVRPDPMDINVEEGVVLYQKHSCQAIIAFGGGSAMDCAKGIAARIAQPHKTIVQMQGVFRVLWPTPMIFAVPTSAGTGSETTIAAVITCHKDHHKASITDLRLMPAYAVLDSELTKTMPPSLTAASGMDALCHAVEAYTNDTYNTDLERDMCRKAVKLVYDNLYQAYLYGDDLDARQNMQWAAFCAGRAFTRGTVGYVHAIGHAMGSLYDIPHGKIVATLLPLVMRQYGASVHKKLAELCDACGIIPAEQTTKAKAEAFIDWIETLNSNMELPKYPTKLEMEDIDQIAAWACAEANPLYPTPVIWDQDEMKQFLLKIKQLM